MYRQGRDRLHAPSPIIKQMVSAGLRGRKSGRGFYTYAEAGSHQVVERALTPAPGGVSDTYAEPGSAQVVDDALTPEPAGVSPVPLRPVRRVGVVGSGTMAT